MDELEPISTPPVRVVPSDPVAALRLALLDLDAQRQSLAEQGDTDALAWGGADLEAIIGDLRDLLRATRADVAVLLDAEHEASGGRGRPNKMIEGLGVVEVWGGMDRKNWESAALLKVLLLRAIVDDDGAFLDMAPIDLVDRIYDVLADCLPITGSTSWKVGLRGKGSGLRGYGIDPSAYCDEVEQPRLAKIPRRRR